MTAPTNTSMTTLLSSAQVEARMNDALGEPVGYWRQFLINNRRAGRSPDWRLPFRVIRGRPFYAEADIDAFIAHCRASRLKRGLVPGSLDEAMKSIGGWPTGRPFDALIAPQIEDSTGVAFVSLHVASPMALFRLTAEQARDVAADLIQAADVIDRAATT